MTRQSQPPWCSSVVLNMLMSPMCRYVDLANCSFGSTAMQHLIRLLRRPQLELCILKGEREVMVRGLFPLWQRRQVAASQGAEQDLTLVPVHPRCG